MTRTSPLTPTGINEAIRRGEQGDFSLLLQAARQLRAQLAEVQQQLLHEIASHSQTLCQTGELKAQLAEAREDVLALTEALENIPTGAYGDAVHEGCDANGAWDVFRDALSEHKKIALDRPGVRRVEEGQL